MSATKVKMKQPEEAPKASAARYNTERLATVLLAPVVSEKGTHIADKHEQAIFKVLADATKPEVKAAVEAMFKVQVESVQIVNVRGKIFPNLPEENFSQKVNRKMYRAGIASILSQLHRDGRLSVIEALAVESPKTRLFAQKIKALGLSGTVLVVTDKLDDNVFLSSRNLTDVLVLETREVDPVSLLRFNNVLLTRAAVAQFEEMLG